LSLGERITVLESGRVSQTGSREELMRAPRSPYVAEFLGVNLFRGTLAPGGSGGPRRIALPHGELVLGEPAEPGELFALVHPREITLALQRPSSTARNVFKGAIEELLPEPPDGQLVRVSIASDPPLMAEVTRQAVGALALAPGRRVYASFKAAGVIVVGEPDSA